MDALRAGLDTTAGVALLRLVPILVAAVCSWRRPVVSVVAAALLASVVGASLWYDPVRTLQAVGALAALTFVGLGFLQALGAEGNVVRITNGARLVTTFGVFMVLPTVLLPALRSVALVVCWDAWLSSYSLWVEHRRSRVPKLVPSGLFFILVDPTLSYPERSQRASEAGFDLHGIGRVGLGLLLLVFASSVAPLLPGTLGGLKAVSAPVRSVVTGAGTFLCLYVSHSGLAHLQIGSMRQLGYSAPERYAYPLAARGMRDFWRRWNTYVVSWLRRYVLRPVARMGSKDLRMGSKAGTAAGMVITFAVAGLLHDAFRCLLNLRVTTSLTLTFTIFGGIAVLWEAADRGLRSANKATGVWGDRLARIAMWGAVAVGAGYWR